MTSEEGPRNLFNQIHKIWVEPELARRKKMGILPNGFIIYRLLILLPQNKLPIIQFNDEIGWMASVKKAPETSFIKDQPVYVFEIEKIETVQPPEIDGVRVAFIYSFFDGKGYQIVFDFTPNLNISDHDNEWNLGEVIAKSLQNILIEKVIHIHDATQKQLNKIGLWAAPALIPYPLSKISVLLIENKLDEARAILLNYCNINFIENLSTKWWNVDQFNKRKNLIENALFAHQNKRYILSIHTLLPHLEGIITDWIYTQLPEEDIPWRQESKTKRFKDLVFKNPPTTFSFHRIVESTLDFIISGPVLKTFKRWIDQIDNSFPNRNVVQHGKYDDSLFTEENSIKLFLLLDTIYYIISEMK